MKMRLKAPQNGDVHLAKIPEFRNGISREPFGTLRSVMARFFAFFTLFHLSLTFFDRMFPLTILHNDCDKVVFSTLNISFMILS